MKNNTIHIIGDSHAECFNHIDFGDTFKVKHLGAILAFNFTKQLPEIVNYLDNNNINKKNDYIFFTPGEIDIRSHIGFQSEKNNITYKEAVEICVNRYLQTLIHIKKLGYNVGVWGPITSGPDEGPQGLERRESFKTVNERNKITCFFNDYLKQVCSQTGIIFKTLYYDIPKVNDVANWDWYSLDGVHLNAGIYYDVPSRENTKVVNGIIPPRQVILRHANPTGTNVHNHIKNKFKDIMLSEKTKVNLYWDKWNFGPEERAGQHPSTASKYIEYTNDPTDIGIFVDYDGSLDNLETIVKNSKHKYKVMVQMEPYTFNIALTDWIAANEDLFDLIFVHYPAWKGTGKYPEKYRYYIAGSRTFIDSNDRQIYPKSKNVTAIWSQKNFGMEGHALRHTTRDHIQSKLKHTVDWNNPVSKVDGLKDYRYEIVVENEFPYFLTEKHLDCMLTGTIPIIWGQRDTKQWKTFDTKGMLFFKTADELYHILTNGILNANHYNSLKDSINYNFKESFNHLSFGDILWEAGLFEFNKNKND